MEVTVEFPNVDESDELATVRALLRDTDPAAVFPPDIWSSDAERVEARRRLDHLLQLAGDDITPEASSLRELPARTTTRRGRRKAVAASAAALTAAAATGIALSLGGAAAAAPALPPLLAFQHGSHVAAVERLNTAAGRLDAYGQRSSGPTIYSKIQEWALNVDVHNRTAQTYLQTTIVEGWYDPDGRSRSVQFSQSAEALTGLAPRGSTGSTETFTTPAGSDANRNAGIPTTSAPAVAAWLGGHLASPNPFPADVSYGGDIFERLSEGNTTAAQTGALYRALATLPGVFDAGVVHDREGRSGQAVGLVVSGAGTISTGTQYLIVDPHTGQVLDIEDVMSPNPPPALHLRPGPVVGAFHVFLVSGQRPGVGE